MKKPLLLFAAIMMAGTGLWAETVVYVDAAGQERTADAFTLQLIGRPVQEDDNAIAAPAAEAPVRRGLYDLSGRPVASPADMQPGVIYIRDGRKVMRMQ